jgi:hypothetical protein
MRPATAPLGNTLQLGSLIDGLREKTDPIARKLVGTEDVQRQAAVKRMELREIVGNKLMREITLK